MEAMRQTIITKNEKETKNLGKEFAKEIIKKKPSEKAQIFGLVGDLGSGKTTFLQGFARGSGIKKRILSPTFVIMKRFKIRDLRFKHLYHIDCYRIQKSKELLALGFKEIISDPRNIVAVEWADRIKKILPKDCIMLRFEFINENTRKITIINQKSNTKN